MEAAIDLSSLTIQDLLEEYKNLYERHQTLKDRSEEDAQRIYELKRNLDTATAAEAYLTQELEQLSVQSSAVGRSLDSKIQQELDELKRKYKQLQDDHETLQQDYDVKADETKKLNMKLEEVTRKLKASPALPPDIHVDCTQRLAGLEAENLELLQKLEEFGSNNVKRTLMVAEKEKTIEVLRDQVGCLEENLRCKRDELEEKMQMLESAQDQLSEANSKIAALSSAPEAQRKGNSLFAEVDDQRQKMKKLLLAQKTSYMQMKKSFSESEYEIRRLKRENMAMHTELKACSTIFCSADRTYHDKLIEHIHQLLNQNETLERKLCWTQGRLKDLAREKSVLWLDSMLNFCKEETDDLKKQLHSVRIQKASLDEQLRNVQQDFARWRFEALKSRCVLIDRENLLLEHKITFKPHHALEFDIKEAEIKAARPRIITVQEQPQATPLPEAQIEPVKEHQTITQEPTTIKVEKPMQADVQEVHASPNTSTIRVMNPTEINNIEFTEPKVASKMEADVQVDVDVKTAIEQEQDIKPIVEMKTKNSDGNEIIEIEDTPIKCKLIARPPTPPKGHQKLTPGFSNKTGDVKPILTENQHNNRQSILVKNRDLFGVDVKKNVQFSASQPTVHNLTPMTSKTGDEVKYVRPKSNVIVKRIIVGQKQRHNNT